MTGALLQLCHALAACAPLDLGQAERLAGQLLAPLDALAAAIQTLVDAPVIGVGLMPFVVLFEVIVGLLAWCVVVALLVGSALVATACADIAAATARATLLLALVHRALGGG